MASKFIIWYITMTQTGILNIYMNLMWYKLELVDHSSEKLIAREVIK